MASLVLLAIIAFVWSWFSKDDSDIYVAKSFIMAVALFTVLSVVVSNFAPREIELKKTEPLYALQDNTGPHGIFVLGSGRVDGEMRYFYLTEEAGGKKLKSIATENVVLYEDETANPRIEFWCNRVKSKFLRVSFITSEEEIIKIYIPGGTIKYEFNVDLR